MVSKTNSMIPLNDFLYAIKSDLSLDNKNFSEKLESIPILLDLHPLSSYVTPIFYRLVEVFIVCDNKTKLRILNICKKCRHHFDAITDFSHIVGPLYRPLYSNDDYARVLNANLLALFSKYISKDDVIVEIIKENIYSPDPNISKIAFAVMTEYVQAFTDYAQSLVVLLMESFYNYPSERVTIPFFQELVDVCCNLSISVVHVDIAFEKFLSEIYLRTRPELDIYLFKFVVHISVDSYKKMDIVLSKVLEHIELTDDIIKRSALVKLIKKFIDGNFRWPEHIIHAQFEVIETLLKEGPTNAKLVSMLFDYLTLLIPNSIVGFKIIFDFLYKYIGINPDVMNTRVAMVYNNLFKIFDAYEFSELIDEEKLKFLLTNIYVDSEVAYKALRSYIISNRDFEPRDVLFKLCCESRKESEREDKLNLAFSVLRTLIYFEPKFTKDILTLAMEIIKEKKGLHLESCYQLIYCMGVTETIPIDSWIVKMEEIEPALLYKIASIAFINGHWSVSCEITKILSRVISGLSQNSLIMLNIIKLMSESSIDMLTYNELENSIDNQELAIGTFEEMLLQNNKSRNMSMIVEFLKNRSRLFKILMSTVSYFNETHTEVFQDHSGIQEYQKFLHEELQYDIVDLDDYSKITDTLISQSIDADYETRLQLEFLNEQILFFKSLLLLLVGDNVIDYIDVVAEKEKDYTEALLSEKNTGFNLEDIEIIEDCEKDDKDKEAPDNNDKEIKKNTYVPKLWGMPIFKDNEEVVTKKMKRDSPPSNEMPKVPNNSVNDSQIYKNSSKSMDPSEIGLTKADMKYIQSRLELAGVVRYQESKKEYSNSKIKMHTSQLFIKYLGEENWEKCKNIADIIEKMNPTDLKEFLNLRDKVFECLSYAFVDYRVMIPFIFYKRSNTVVQLDICPKEEIDNGILLPDGGVSLNVEAIINFTTIHYKFSRMEIELIHYEDGVLKKSIVKEGSKGSDNYFKETFFLNIEKNGCLKMTLSGFETRSEDYYQLAERSINYRTTKD
uniref:Non-specific serine/threonine protein kinase n=1 Tax=Parastrongyloides trichosuri TaxID=131310 RepID=A0A0N4ZWF2_PARTI